jgi:hypothetical protein
MTLTQAEKGTPDVMWITHEQVNDFDGPFLFITGTDFTYYPNGKIYMDFTCNADFHRLKQIRQLGTVGASCYAACQDQDRGFHSWVAGVMMDIVLFRNGFGEHDRKLGIAAGLYHDLAIMPYSDQGKLLDSSRLDEEHLVAKVIRASKDIKAALKKHGVSIDELVATIKGEGIVGRLLNSKEGIDVDNLSYLAIDHVWAPGCGIGMSINSESFRKVDVLDFSAKMDEGVLDQYNNMRHIDGDWVFDNPRMLVQLLRFRAEMYVRVYHHRDNRAKEAFLIRDLRGHKMSFKEAIKLDDSTFYRWFENEIGKEKAAEYLYTMTPRFREIGREYDLSKLEELRQERETGEVVVERLKPPRDAIKNLVLYRGKVRQLEGIRKFEKELGRVRVMIERLDYIGIYQRIPKEEVYRGKRIRQG